MDWYNSSQVNMGLILKGVRLSQSYSSEDMHPPYDKMLDYMKEHEDWSKEDLYSHFAPSDLDNALHAVQSLNGSSVDVDWPEILRTTSNKWKLGNEFERTGKALKRGETPEVIHLRSDLDALTTNQTLGAERADRIDLTDVSDLQPSGWKEIDTTFGGMPKTGPLVIYGTTGTGKSFCTSKYVKEFLKHYPERTAGVYSLEMSSSRYLKRSLSIYPDIEEIRNRLWISGKARNIEDITSEASVKGYDLVVIDSIDYLPTVETSPSVVDRLWKAIVRMGRLLEIPIIVTAQPNRVGKQRVKTEFLQKYDIIWSGSAEDAAEQLIALQYIRDSLPFSVSSEFPVFDEAFYMINWKQRGGWPEQKGPGAIIFHKDDQIRRNGERVLWEGACYKNTLWKAGSSVKISHSKKSKRFIEEDEEE